MMTDIPIVACVNNSEFEEALLAVKDTYIGQVIVKNSADAYRVVGFDILKERLESLILPSSDVRICLDVGDNSVYAKEAASRGMKMVNFTGSAAMKQKLAEVFGHHGTEFMPESEKMIDFWGASDIYSQCKNWLEVV